jgi:drug/metabolite transporter (DMT)-like permease
MSTEPATSTDSAPPLFHGKFIPDDPHPLPLPSRSAIFLGVALVILVLAFVSWNTLESWGEWVTLCLVSALTAGTAVVWFVDAGRRPATELDADESP